MAMGFQKSTLWLGSALVALCCARGSQAQEADDKAADDRTADRIIEVVVTAERREASAQRSAVAVTAVTGEELVQEGIQDVMSLTDAVPGFEVTSATPNANLVLRGISAGGSAQFTTPSVQFSIFGVPLSRQHSTIAAFYDLERVEVLKGPQGTLYGRNSNVGAVNLIPRRPRFEYEGEFNVTVADYGTLNTSGGISLPLSDTVATRVAFSTNQHDGYLSNGYNDANNQSGRISLLAQPNPALSALFFVDYFRNDSNGPSTINRYSTPGQEFQVPDDPWFAFEPAGCGNPLICPTWADSAGPGFVPPLNQQSVVGDDGFLEVEQLMYGAEINYDFGPAVLTVIPAVVTTRVEFLSYSTGFNFRVDDDTAQRSLEARLASDGDGRLSWILGAIYFREDQDSKNFNFEPPGYQVINTPNLVTESVGLFSQATFSLTDSLRLVAGLRYTDEEKSIDGSILVGGPPNATNCPAPAVGFAGPQTAYGNFYPIGYCLVPNAGTAQFDDISYRAGFEWDVAADSLLYASVRSGFKSGGLNPGLPPNSYEPEKLIAYEIGSKNLFFDHTLQANLEIFYWDYEDQQIGIRGPLNPAGQAPRPVNVPGNLYGVEGDFVWAPTAADELSLNALYSQGKFDIFPQIVNSSGVIGGLVDFDRYSLPEWSLTAAYSHTFAFASGAELIPRAQLHYESDMLMAPLAEDQQRPGDFRDAFAKWDFDLTYVSPQRRWRTSVFVKNLTDEAIVGPGTTNTVGRGIFYRPPGNPVDARYAAIEAPRTYGARFTVSF